MRQYYSALASALLLIGGGAVKADWDYWGVKHTGSSGDDNVYGIYTINSETGTSTFRNQIQTPTGMNYDESYTNSSDPNKLILDVGKTNLWEYDLDSDSWTELTNVTNWRGDMDGEFNKLLITESSDGVTSIGKNS